MISFEQAKSIVIKEILEMGKKSNIKLALLDSETITFEYGWVFFYQSEEFVKTRDMNALVGGNAPILIDKEDGAIYPTGTSYDVNYYIERYSALKKG